MLRRRLPILDIVIASALLFPACASSDEGSVRTQTPASPTPTTSPSSSEAGYVVTDVQLIKTPDPVAQVIWSISFDARWSGPGAPEPTRCRWQMLDEKKVPIADGIVDIDEPAIDDAETPSIYPDEFAGVPRAARITC